MIGEVCQGKENLKTINQVLRDSKFGRKMDYANLMEKKVLNKFRQSKLGVSLFINK